MKKYFGFSKKYILVSALLFLGVSCKKSTTTEVTPAPRIDYGNTGAIWQEHWFGHTEILTKVYGDTSNQVYYDNGVRRTTTWPYLLAGKMWNYTKKTYGQFGAETNLYCVYHAGHNGSDYSGGHPSTYMDANHDYRNTIDIGSNASDAWQSGQGNDIDITAHEIGHIVEGASKGVHGSPAFGIWHDSKWMEIYQYDLYLGIGLNEDATRWYNKMQTASDNYPRAGTQWFKNWFYPIYNQYGQTAVLNKFFNLLAINFPQQNYNNGQASYPEYKRGMNMGEFVHFWSGAANADLKALALAAFGTNDENGNNWTTQLSQAKVNFPSVTY